MITQIFHGDDIASSRGALLEKLKTAQKSGQVIKKIELDSVGQITIDDLTASDDLFGNPPLLILENLHAGVKSKKRDQFIKEVADLEQETWLWEKKAITKLMLSNFPGANVHVFNLKNPVWGFLGSFSPDKKDLPKTITLFRQSLAAGNDVFYLFSMVIWQIRQLLTASEGVYAGSPAMRATTLQKGEAFGTQKLLALHHELLNLDLAAKTSGLKLPLENELEYFFAKFSS